MLNRQGSLYSQGRGTRDRGRGNSPLILNVLWGDPKKGCDDFVSRNKSVV
jgi:hypothetical protein